MTGLLVFLGVYAAVCTILLAHLVVIVCALDEQDVACMARGCESCASGRDADESSRLGALAGARTGGGAASGGEVDVLRAGKDKYERLLRDKPRIGRDYGPFNARPTRAELEQEREEMVAQHLKRLEEEDYGRRLDSARKEPKIHEILEGALGPLGMGEPAKKEVE